MRLAVWSLIGSLALLTATDDKNFGKCPISGKPAIKEQSVDYLGKKVYFCCENCPGSFDKVKHAYKANLQLLETKQMMQIGCPISGAKVNKDQMVDVEGQKIGFCCEKCKAKYDEADADGKAKILFSNLKKAYTLQTKCPVSGEAIKLDCFTKTSDDKKVYFCCGECKAAYEKDPPKYAEKLPKE